MLKASLTAGVLAIGGNVIDAGIIPTPAVAYLVRYFHATAGVVISASHNPFEYNGIKFFNGEGYKLDDSIEDEIENILMRNLDLELIATGDMLGKMLTAESDGQEVYSRFLINSTDVDLKGKRIVLDCANGAAYKIAARVYSALGAKVITIGDDPNGTNINDGVGSTHPEALQRAVVENGAFIGMLKMKDGAILANAGHFNCEIDMAELEEKAEERKESRQNIMKHMTKIGKFVCRQRIFICSTYPTQSPLSIRINFILLTMAISISSYLTLKLQRCHNFSHIC